MYLLASQTVASCQGEGTKHSDTMLKSYIREALGEERAGKRLCKSTGRPVCIFPTEMHSRMQCCQSLQSHPHKALIYYRITPKHLTLPLVSNLLLICKLLQVYLAIEARAEGERAAGTPMCLARLGWGFRYAVELPKSQHSMLSMLSG